MGLNNSNLDWGLRIKKFSCASKTLSDWELLRLILKDPKVKAVRYKLCLVPWGL